MSACNFGFGLSCNALDKQSSSMSLNHRRRLVWMFGCDMASAGAGAGGMGAESPRVEGKAPGHAPWSWRQFYYTVSNFCGWRFRFWITSTKTGRYSANRPHFFQLQNWNFCGNYTSANQIELIHNGLSCLRHEPDYAALGGQNFRGGNWQ